MFHFFWNNKGEKVRVYVPQKADERKEQEQKDFVYGDNGTEAPFYLIVDNFS